MTESIARRNIELIRDLLNRSWDLLKRKTPLDDQKPAEAHFVRYLVALNLVNHTGKILGYSKQDTLEHLRRILYSNLN